MYELRCMGEISLRSPTGEIIRFRSRKHLALLIYLAVNGERAHRREPLASLLWSDSDTSKARHSLSQALYAVRQRVDGTVRIEGDALELDPSRIRVDSVELERYLKAGDSPSAVELYRGEFLEGFFVRRAQGFEDWLERERARVGSLARQALRGAIQVARERCEWSVVRGHCQRLVRLDPYDESAYAELMRALWMLGDRAGALELYDQLKDVLKGELGTQPSGETTGLAERIRKLSVRGGWRGRVLREAEPEAFTDPPFVGRKKELGTLTREWDHVLKGETRAVALVGEAGIGKTRLATEFIKSLAVDDVQVLKGRCYEAEQVLPYGPVAEAFRETLDELDLSAVSPRWLAELARIVPEVAERFADLPEPPVLEAEGSRRRLYEGIAQVLRDLCEQRPLVFFVDDVHWADESSLSLLHYLLRRVNNGMYLLCALRNEEGRSGDELLYSPLLRDRRDGVVFVEISALAKTECSALLSYILGNEELALKEMNRLSAGNPFFAIELAREIPENDSRSVPTGENVLPRTVKAVLARRFNGLRTEAVALAEQASVLGSHTTWGMLAIAMSLSHTELQILGRELLDKGILFEDRERVGFRHHLLKSYVRGQIGHGRLRILHLRAARALIHVNGESNEIARHYHAAGDRKRAYAHALKAARQAQEVFALAESAELLELALKNSNSGATSAELWGRLGGIYIQLRRYDRAEELLTRRLRYLREVESSVECEAECTLQRILLALERGLSKAASVIKPLQELEARIGDQTEKAQRTKATILAKIYWASVRAGDLALTRTAIENLQKLEHETDCPEVLWKIYRTAAIHNLYSGDLESATRLLRESSIEAQRAGDQGGILDTFIGLSILAIKSLDPSLCEELLEKRGLFESYGDPVRKAALLGNCAVSLLHRGELDQAHSLLSEARQSVDALDESVGANCSLTYNLGYHKYLLGRLREAEKRWNECLLASRSSGFITLQVEALSGLAVVALDRGDLEEARRLMAMALSKARSIDSRFLDNKLLLEEGRARLAVKRGKQRKAMRRLSEIARLSHDSDIPLYLHVQRLLQQLKESTSKKEMTT